MRIALISDTFPPLCTSGGVQLRDLSREFYRQGHTVSILLPSQDLKVPWSLEVVDGVEVVRLKAPRTKGFGYLRRTLGEFVMPFAMIRQFRKSPLAGELWEGVVWYSPSIFHGPLVRMLKKSSGCKGYLIIRDIFPEWALDMGLMGRGLPYKFFDAVARYQYSTANVIGVQTAGNLSYFEQWKRQPGRKLEVLQNWLDKPGQVRCSIRVSETSLAGRKVLLYTGNMGVAQGMDILIDLAEKLNGRSDIGFLFVGRGSEVTRLKTSVKERKLSNILFFDEIHPDEIPDLCGQCSVGIVALDSKLKSHNIPGKFLTYIQSGLPVLANVNAGNDLVQMIRSEKIGQVCESNRLDELSELVDELLIQMKFEADLPVRCRSFFEREFSVENAVLQIVSALTA